MNQSLFSEFTSTNKFAWQQQAIKDLKGKDFDETLLWKTEAGLTVEPYYTAEDLTDERLIAIRNIQPKTNTWFNQSVIRYSSEKETNSLIISTLKKGTDALYLDLSLIDITTISLPKLLNSIKLSETPVVFQTNAQSAELLSALAQFIPYQMKGGLADDGLARWMTQGVWAENYFETLSIHLRNTQNSPYFRTIGINVSVYHNAGANAVQELAFALASAVTYIDKLTDLGMTFEDVSAKISFTVSVGTQYFLEIAKLRALRYLWMRICTAYEAPLPYCHIQAHTSTFYDAAITPNTNMLRATTEAMSAVIGGCDVLTVHAFDATFKESDEFSERIARNISTLLKDEAHLDKTADPAAGSYFIENLTLQLIDAAWTLFLEVESKGGWTHFVQLGVVQGVHIHR